MISCESISYFCNVIWRCTKKNQKTNKWHIYIFFQGCKDDFVERIICKTAEIKAIELIHRPQVGGFKQLIATMTTAAVAGSRIGRRRLR